MKKGKNKLRFAVLTLVIIALITTIYINKLDSLKYRDLGTKSISTLNKHNYDWSFLSMANDKKQYIQNDGTHALVGIDVSTHQGDIDWEKVKNENIDFAFIRTGYRGYERGEIVEDDKFKYNIQSANEKDIDVGVYFFSQAISIKETVEEAKFVVNLIKDYDVKYPIAFDMEYVENGRIQNLSIIDKTKIALAFCEEIEKNGYSAMVYGSTSWLQNAVMLPDIIEYDLWVSDYANTPSFPYEFQMWQYTDQGKIDGISGNVDLNLCFVQYKNNKYTKL